jgi:Raf kinase inhibitor-like YbhB/YbcL family protein
MKRVLVVVVAAALAAGPWMAGCRQPTKRTKEPENRLPETSGGVTTVFKLTSPVFENNQLIPVRYANKSVNGGQNISIPLTWEDAPEGTKSFAIAIIDRHPIARNFMHWLVIDIPGDVTSLPEGASNSFKMPPGSRELITTYGTKGYGGPAPPRGSGAHDYETTIYALSVEKLDLSDRVSLEEFTRSVEKNALASAALIGKFSR